MVKTQFSTTGAEMNIENEGDTKVKLVGRVTPKSRYRGKAEQLGHKSTIVGMARASPFQVKSGAEGIPFACHHSINGEYSAL
jgi:copper(I)-binding protein